MNTAQKIELRKAEAKFTRAKERVTETPTARNETLYQKAKKDLSVLRRSLRGHTPHQKNGSAVAKPATLTVKATDPRKG